MNSSRHNSPKNGDRSSGRLDGQIARVFANPVGWKWVTRFEKGDVVEVHHPRHLKWMKTHKDIHAHREMMLVLAGTHFYGVRDRIYRASPGTAFLFDHGEPHDICYSPYQPDCLDLWLHLVSARQITINEVVFRGGRIQNFTGNPSDGTDRAIQHYMPLHGSLVECFTQCWDTCSDGDVTPLTLAQLKAAATIVLLQVWKRHVEAVNAAPETSQQTAVIHQIQNYIIHNLNGDLSLQALSRIGGYDPVYLHRLFWKHTGETVRRYINRHRLERAKILLQEGRTVESVASDLGFGSPGYFSRFFKSATGSAPSDWKPDPQGRRAATTDQKHA